MSSEQHQHDTIRCWQCGEPNKLSAIICTSCNSLQVPRQIDAFQLFEMTPSFKIDEEELERNYLALQQKVHPDRYATAGAKEMRFATAHSLLSNEAYEILKTPLGRAEYLLEKQGLIVNRDGADSVKASQSLLMESLEAREKLSKLTESEALRAMQQEVKEQCRKCLATLTSHFVYKDYKEAAQETIRLKYLLKLEREIKEKKRNV